MASMGLVPGDVKVQAWLSIFLLALCILNSSGLLLARFLSRAGESSIRRALGARRSQLFCHFLAESSLVGLAASLFAVATCWFGTRLLQQRPADYAGLAHLDTHAIIVALLLSLGACLMAAVIPAWRSSSPEPAIGVDRRKLLG